MKRIRAFFESIAYAGMKPAGQKGGNTQRKWLGPLSGPIERFLSGSAPSDPLYLTNRSFGQKLRFWVVIALPCLVLAAGIGVALSNILDPPKPKVTQLTAKEVSAKILPNMDANLKVEQNSDVEVIEVKIDHQGGSHLTGIVRNTTNRNIAGVQLVVDLTDNNGSQVGGVGVRVEGIPAAKTKSFSVPIQQHTAAFALVREVGPAR